MTETEYENYQNDQTTDENSHVDEEILSLEEQCKQYICPTCPVNIEATDTKLRALAEMENFKKRLQKEHAEQTKHATERILTDMLPVIDSLDLAIQYGDKQEACKDMLVGVSMTRKLFLDALKPYGLNVIGELGEPFNPDTHEAVAHEEHESIPDGHISTLHQKGYQLHERLLRPAKVSVSNSKK